MIIRIIISILVGYLLGSVSFAVILSKCVIKKDVRELGSGNAGATNMARVFGMGPGLATLFADGLKTAAAMLLGKIIGGETCLIAAGGACIIGHCYPVFFSFRGGKGVSVGAAAALILDWRLFLILVVVFFTVFFIKKTVSICSISCAVAFPIVQLILGHSAGRVLLGTFVGACIVFLHRSNIRRIIAGTEAQFKPKSAK